ncbi:Peptidyl-tRNA hydrolase, chloroplastic, partial [Cucurbita argyrosperma subsp. sororia]
MSTSSPPITDHLAVDDKKPAPPPKPWLIVGLGNPGKKYDRTRHNLGFEMVDPVAEAEGISRMRSIIDHLRGSRDYPRWFFMISADKWVKAF